MAGAGALGPREGSGVCVCVCVSLALVDVGRSGQVGVGALVLDERLHRRGVGGQLRLLAEEGLARVVPLLPELRTRYIFIFKIGLWQPIF